ncbi:MAG: glycosyltransferase family 4 protein [Cyclobacteriaceae bacterium]|nr:glycosyltransferase family 4 protein [Cyclobacteriaceae bacterium HetDA_MAG_MS6]
MNLLITTAQGGIAGSTFSILYLAEGLTRRGHEVTLGCKREMPIWDLAQDLGIACQGMSLRSKFSWTEIQQFARVVKESNIQIVNAQSSIDRYLSVFAKWIFRLSIKIVHTRRQYPRSVGGLQNLVYVKGTDKIVAVSYGVRKRLLQTGISADHIQVIQNGIDLGKLELINDHTQDRLRMRYEIKEGEFVIGCVSRLKKQHQLVEALHHVKRPCTILFIGIDQCSVPEDIGFPDHHTFHFLGKIDVADVMNFYRLMNVKILPSIREGLSQSLLEAMAVGTPVIATDASGNPDLVHHRQTGLLYSDGHIQQLARYINELIEDEALSNTLSRTAKQYVTKNFHIDRTVDAYEDFFVNLLKR